MKNETHPCLWILDDDDSLIPIAFDESERWADWMRTHRDRVVVAQEKIGRYTLSTVFLGVDIDIAAAASEAPKLYETLIIGAAADDGIAGDSWRTGSRTFARETHDYVAKALRRLAARERRAITGTNDSERVEVE